MTDTRRLSAEMRKDWKSVIDPNASDESQAAMDALHDLDVADRERDQAYRDREQAIGFLDQRIAELAAAQAALAGQRAAIAEMREKIAHAASNNMDDQGYMCPFCTGCGDFTKPKHDEDCISLNTDIAQLAADHDAAVRADERRKVLEEIHEENMRDRINASLAAQPEEAGER